MPNPRVIILSGYGLNCEQEAQFAFEQSGATAEIVHINDVIDELKKLSDYQILVVPGGFSYGDDTGSGNAFANRIRNHLWDQFLQFIEDDRHLVMGICNGFQILTNLGALPAIDHEYGIREAALLDNESARFLNRWVDVEFSGTSPWVGGGMTISMPIAHGEGRLVASNETIEQLNKKSLIAARYIKGEMCEYQNMKANPNGSTQDIAGLTDETGRILGIMPHPERASLFTHAPNWTVKREMLVRAGKPIPHEGDGLQIFKNGVRYFGN